MGGLCSKGDTKTIEPEKSIGDEDNGGRDTKNVDDPKKQSAEGTKGTEGITSAGLSGSESERSDRRRDRNKVSPERRYDADDAGHGTSDNGIDRKELEERFPSKSSAIAQMLVMEEGNPVSMPKSDDSHALDMSGSVQTSEGYSRKRKIGAATQKKQATRLERTKTPEQAADNPLEEVALECIEGSAELEEGCGICVAIIRRDSPSGSGSTTDSLSRPALSVETTAVGTRQKDTQSESLNDCDVNDLWHLGNCTKTLTALLMATITEHSKWKDKISYETTLQEWADTYKAMADEYEFSFHPSYGDSTIYELATHSSGVPGGRGDKEVWDLALEEDIANGAAKNNNPSEADTRRQRCKYLSGILKNERTIDRGNYCYSNAGYSLLGLILEFLTGKTYESLLATYLWKPLGIPVGHYGFGPPGWQHENLAARMGQPWGHGASSSWKPKDPAEEGADNPACLQPALRAHCTMNAWTKAMMCLLDKDLALSQLGISNESWKILTNKPGAQGLDYGSGGVFITQRAWAPNGRMLNHEGTNSLNYCVTWLGNIEGENEWGLLIMMNLGAKHVLDHAVVKLLRYMKLIPG